MKHKLRHEASFEFRKAALTALYKAIEQPEIYPFQSCLSCINFRELNEICGLANQRPPAKVIVYGCQMYEDKDDIPF